MKIAVLASGSGSNLQTLIDQLHLDTEVPVEIALVVSDNPDAYALARAEAASIPTKVVRTRDYETRVLFDAAIADKIEGYGCELVVLAGYMRVFQPPFVQHYRGRILNIHPALLPSFPGAHGVPDALKYGVKVTGVTIHFVDEGVDTGPIIMQAAVPVLDDDDEASLHQRIQVQEHRLYPQAVRLYAEGKLKLEGRYVRIVD